jgi:hypothetical protein
MSQNSRNQGFSYYICLMKEGSGSRAGSGSGFIPLTNGSGSGSRRSKNTWIRWIRIRIRNTVTNYHPFLPVAFYMKRTVMHMLYDCICISTKCHSAMPARGDIYWQWQARPYQGNTVKMSTNTHQHLVKSKHTHKKKQCCGTVTF